MKTVFGLQSKAEIKAVKAQRKAQRKRPAESEPAYRSTPAASAAATQPQAPAAVADAVLPADFFQSNTKRAKVAEDSPAAPVHKPATGKTEGAAAGKAATDQPGSALPKGFFDDKAADGVAQGEKPKTKKQVEADFEQFQREVDDMEKAKAEAEGVAVAEASERQHALEQFELQCAATPQLSLPCVACH